MPTKKILISWYDHLLDFRTDEKSIQLNTNGPTFLFHNNYYKGYHEHIILSSEKDKKSDEKLSRLEYFLGNQHFPNHKITPTAIDLKDISDVEEIKTKVEAVMKEYVGYEICCFVPLGTTSMRIVWAIIHFQKKFNTKLITFRPPRGGNLSKDVPELVELAVEQSPVPIHLEAREKSIGQRGDEGKIISSDNKNFLETESLTPSIKKALLAAKTDCRVLIYGENGVGKGEIAKFIHEKSERRDKPYLEINCASLNDELLESRLFGYQKGSFTGAQNDHKGFFEMYDGGTIFLDEIGDISPYMQQSLLRVLQEKTVMRIGDSKPINVDVRIIAATNRDLIQAVVDEKFRQDLYFRLAVVEIELPPLRERGKKERTELLDFLLKKMQMRYKRAKSLQLSKELQNAIMDYPFYGNVREMEHMIEYFYVMMEDQNAPEEVPKSFLPKRMERMAKGEKVSLLWADVEKAHIQKVLRMYKGNLTQAQKAMGLGTNTETIRKKIKKYEIDLEAFKE